MEVENKEAYKVAEAARLMGCSMRTIVRRFQGERGVIVLNPNGKRRSLRIPRHVFERVVRRWTVQ